MAEEKRWVQSNRLTGLRSFAFAITAFNILGHTFLGFEQSWAQPLVSLATGYSMEIVLELLDAVMNRKKPRFTGGMMNFVNFLLSAHITSLAVAMLLYPNDHFFPIAFATATAIASKNIFRLRVGEGSRHFLNPSNLGITITLLLFPWVGIAPPYHFTENLNGIGNWILPGLIVVSGSFLNARFTRRIPLLVAWIIGFLLQAGVRSLAFDLSFLGELVPMTGMAFILYSFYMVTDPPTTPSKALSQVAFGLSVATVYGLLMVGHIVFGLFFALTIVCSVRGIWLYISALFRKEEGHLAQEAKAASIVSQSPTLLRKTDR